jgi:hypothetical protein
MKELANNFLGVVLQALVRTDNGRPGLVVFQLLAQKG